MAGGQFEVQVEKHTGMDDADSIASPTFAGVVNHVQTRLTILGHNWIGKRSDNRIVEKSFWTPLMYS